jgi:hypothetical protein
MKLLLPIAALILAQGCATSSDTSRYSIRSLSGRWHSMLSINATDYRLEDCRYERNGSFECIATDRGCDSGFCEGESTLYSGSWSLEGSRLTRRITKGSEPNITTVWEIQGWNEGVLSLSGGERWFRDEKTRNQHVVGAP